MPVVEDEPQDDQDEEDDHEDDDDGDGRVDTELLQVADGQEDLAVAAVDGDVVLVPQQAVPPPHVVEEVLVQPQVFISQEANYCICPGTSLKGTVSPVSYRLNKSVIIGQALFKTPGANYLKYY